ncbi:hypothetical protein M9Y10_027979 [Tritrichomonas musculus]|uniref:Protein kinase domain-containing protein n=1 Tax=Tritrichomonas musculus TaxID=1915356 RepID=A0ABR2KLC3_9EUKA
MNIISTKLINLKKNLFDISKTPISSEGAYGVVYKGKFKTRIHHEDVVIDCAIKYMRTKNSFQQDFELFTREVSNQMSLKHPALLELLGHYIPFCNVGKLTIVTPFMKNGSLCKVLADEKKSSAPHEWTETTRAINIIGIAAGLCYMHQKNLIHRDLKPDNILLDDKFYPKICDFGFSKIFEEGLEAIVNATYLGTQIYMAPELITSKGCNSKIDVFSYALILYELFVQETAFESSKNKNVHTYLECVVNGTRPNIKNDGRFPPFFQSLIDDCWAQDPKDRPSFNKILSSILEAYKNEEIFDSSTVDRDEIDEYILDAIENLDYKFDFK